MHWRICIFLPSSFLRAGAAALQGPHSPKPKWLFGTVWDKFACTYIYSIGIVFAWSCRFLNLGRSIPWTNKMQLGFIDNRCCCPTVEAIRRLHKSHIFRCSAAFLGSPSAAYVYCINSIFVLALFIFPTLSIKFTMQNSYSPSHQNVGIYMEY
jgi:hypothetical protein